MILPHLGQYFLCLGGNPLVGTVSNHTPKLQREHFFVPLLLNGFLCREFLLPHSQLAMMPEAYR